MNVVISEHALERGVARHPGSRKTAKRKIVCGVREALVDGDRVTYNRNAVVLAHRDGRRWVVTFGADSILVVSCLPLSGES